MSTVQAPAPAPKAQAAVCDANDLGGQVWRDFNANGQQDNTAGFTEPGFYDAGITVVAYDENNGQIATTTLASDGSYVFDNLFAAPNANRPVRIEFEGLPDYMEEGASGLQNGTSVQFYSASSCSADFGVNYPIDYCQADPGLVTSAFRNGDPGTAGGDPRALFQFNYSDSGTTGVASHTGPAPTSLATKAQLGSVWGLAYNRANGVVYSASFAKRHAGLKDNKGGVIYATDVNSGATTTLVDLTTRYRPGTASLINVGTIATNASRGLGNYTQSSIDAWAYLNAGKIGLGDIDISDDMSTLYVMNLADKYVYGIDLNSPGKDVVSAFSAVGPGIATCSPSGSPGGNWRPFALKYYHGDLYMGGVCDRSTTAPAGDGIRVYRWNGTLWSLVMKGDLNYQREPAWNYSACVDRRGWYDWTTDLSYPAHCGGSGYIVVNPQPLLSDIEFDSDGNILLGVMDRAGHQWGYQNTAPDGNVANSISGIIGGDILRAQANGDGTYTMEEPVAQPANLFSTEYFGGEEFSTHLETALGSLAVLPGSNQVVLTAIDPFRPSSDGIYWHKTNVSTNSKDQGYELNAMNDSPYAGKSWSKAAGLGDLELLCDSAPIDVGNRIWKDTDGDGIQDPGEPGMGGVTLNLYEDPNGIPGDGDEIFVGTTTTDANGEYYFKGLDPNTNYYIEIDDTSSTLQNYDLTTQDYAANASDTDDEDSDAAYNGTTDSIIMPFTTGEAGRNDYTLDAGFSPLGAIGNYVWLDEDNDGYQDAGERGIPNVVVTLTPPAGVDLGNGPGVAVTTTTDANGGYLFPNLPAADGYIITIGETQPALSGLNYTVPNNSGNANQEDFGNQNPAGYTIDLSPGEVDLSGDFGYNYNTNTEVNDNTGLAAIGDRVWIDSDGDGKQDPNEVGVEGVEVTLYTAGPDGIFGTADDVAAETTMTDANGYYIFDNLTPGAYAVGVTNSGGASQDVLGGSYTQTGDPDHFGTTGTNNDNYGEPVVLAPGDVFLNMDFGYQPGAAVLNSIGDTIFYDADADGNGPSMTAIDDGTLVTQGAGGTADSTDYGISGVTVALIDDLNGNGVWDADEPIIATDVTDENGQYLFSDLPDGDYIVWVNDTDGVLTGLNQSYDADGTGTPNTSAVTNLSGGTDVRDQDFGYSNNEPGATTGTIGDYVWYDLDGDGVQDANEAGIGGVKVTLTFPDGSTISTVTDENGKYIFTGLPIDADGESYTVTVDPTTLPSGVTQTYDDDGVGTPNTSTTTISTANPIDLDQDFGYNGNNTLGNLVWEDSNADGVFNNGESLLGGVTLDIYRDTNGNGVFDSEDALVTTVVTSDTATDTGGDTGNYLVEGLPDGTYFVNVSDDDSVLNGYWHSLGMPNTTNNSQNDAYYAVDLDSEHNSAGGVTDLTADFGYYVKPAAVGNFVWVDLNNDGIQDTLEPPIEGVEVQMLIEYPGGQTVTLVTTTDANGYYSFNNLLLDEDYNGDGSGPEPTYTISIDPNQTALLTLSEGKVLNDTTTGAVTNVTNDSNEHSGTSAQPVQGLTDTSLATADTTDIASYDFGYTANLALGGTLWNDYTGSGDGTGTANDGVYQVGEEVLDGVTVKLYAANPDGSLGDPVDDPRNPGTPYSVVTDANGAYLFDGLAPGDYIVVVENFATQTGLTYSTLGALDPDDSTAGDKDTGLENGTVVQSAPITLEALVQATATGSEPDGERENGLYSTLLTSSQDGRMNYNVDLGFTDTALAVSLSYAYAERGDDGTIYFIWETATETGNAGFNLYMELADASQQLVNSELVSSSVIDSVTPTRYTYQASVAGERYYIELVSVAGAAERHGPYALGREYGEPADADHGALTNPLYLPLIMSR
ncbi:MAG: hypothetical protein H6642_14935 [Caldilineaceae bacterium]|nr:hypothetical protein [Caldilineaceae bacterium]